MNDIIKSPIQRILSNALKSFAVLAISSLAFVLVISFFPLIGSLTMDNFPIQQVIKDNFKLLVPLLTISLFICPLFGWVSYKFKRKRLLYLFAIGIVSCWLTIILYMFILSGFAVNKSDMGLFALISIWAFVGYSFFSLPILVPAIFIIERITREETGKKSNVQELQTQNFN